jgi:predicted TIM-barrel fold metal-dependent hydrolase
MPLRDSMKLISVDDHLLEHGSVWQDRLPARYRDEGPRLVEHEGYDYWQYEGVLEPAFTGLGGAAGRAFEDYTIERVHASDVLPGCTDPVARLRDMDVDGVWAQLCFPSYPRFAGTRFLHAKDKDLALACLTAYNDFVIDEWCAANRERFIPLCLVPLWDVDLAVRELERVVARGARSVTFPENTHPLGLASINSGYWDPLFAAAAQAQVPLSVHFGTSGVMPKPNPESNDAAYIALMGTNSMDTCADYCFSDVFHKFPGLKIALSEGGIGWIPWLKERMDYTWERQRAWTGINADVKPSELFDQHIYGCFIDDEAGIELRHKVGLNNIMLESDYPHSDSSWPNTRKRAQEVLVNVPDDEAHRIVELNARELYNFAKETHPWT